jgi:hypothetical protein
VPIRPFLSLAALAISGGALLVRRWRSILLRSQAGMSTAEYAVGTVAACAFAAVLFKVVTGGSIVTALGHLITKALETLS